MGGISAGVLRGAAAGAAGTTALNAATYLDMALRGRPASSTPEESVEQLAGAAGVEIPGDRDERHNRVAGLGPLLGLAAGVGTGVVLGAARGLGWQSRYRTTAVAATLVAMLAGNAPMAGLGISDPRSWSAEEWLADVLPHVAYGVVAAGLLTALEPAGD